MWRRIYLSFPTADEARRVVSELETAGVSEGNIHTVAGAGVDITDLPVANEAQRRDRIWFWEQVFWYGNLAFFATALAATALAFYAGLIGWALIGVALAATAYLAGDHFAVRVPHAHLAQMRVPLAHGEVVLLVDVPRTRVREIEKLASRHHPEAGIGGVGWTITSTGL